MRIREIMTADCETCSTGDLVSDVAAVMAKNDVGFLPVAEDDRLIGTVTDRDIVIRGVAKRADVSSTKVADVMSDQLYYCFDDQECPEVAANMAEKQIRRMPVVDREKRLVGTVSLGDMAKGDTPVHAGQALAGIAATA